VQILGGPQVQTASQPLGPKQLSPLAQSDELLQTLPAGATAGASAELEAVPADGSGFGSGFGSGSGAPGDSGAPLAGSALISTSE